MIAPDSYPALHIYLYSALSWLTDRGKHLERAQWAFAGIYLATMAVVLFGIYRRNKKVSSVSPPFLESKLCCSTRRETTRVPRAETGGYFAPELLFAPRPEQRPQSHPIPLFRTPSRTLLTKCK